MLSAGGVVAELEESAGAAGAVVEESVGALGEVDCCFEQATMASALRHNKMRLRFMGSPLLWIGPSGSLAAPGGTQRMVAIGVPGNLARAFFVISHWFNAPGKLEATALRAPAMLHCGALIRGTSLEERSYHGLGQMPATGNPVESGSVRSDGHQ